VKIVEYATIDYSTSVYLGFANLYVRMGAYHAPPPSHRGQSVGFLEAAIGPSPDRQASLPPWPPVIADAQATGAKSLRQITAALNGRSIAAARAGEREADGGEPLSRVGQSSLVRMRPEQDAIREMVALRAEGRPLRVIAVAAQ